MRNKPYSEFVSAHSTPYYVSASEDETQGALLWGDGVRRLDSRRSNGRVAVKARGKTGWVSEDALGGESLLEVYFIDVGQGDGVLIKTPDFRHIMIDGGNPRLRQITGKNSADFVDWKFVKDYGRRTIELDAMIASHNDLDHYGGLADLLDAAQQQELDAKSVTLEAFFHAGLSWWKRNGKRSLGQTVQGGRMKYYIDLLSDRASAEAATSDDAEPRLQGDWAAFISKVLTAKTSHNDPTPFERLSHSTEYLPGFGPDDGPVAVRVLGPVEAEVDGAPALPKFSGDDSISTNGNSVLLRLDYGQARIMLTGDLNMESQRLLLETYTGNRLEFQCDVAKGCHHGSEDVSVEFLKAMRAAATVISSGDAEGHDHPRPRIVAASGATGYLHVEEDKIVTPLVYSTELARSTSLGTPVSLHIPGASPKTVDGDAIHEVEVTYSERLPGAIKPREGKRTLDGACVVAGLIYGLVNMRTDGETILLATLNEGKGSWTVKTFKSRF